MFATLASASQVWVTVDATFEDEEAHLHLPAVFEAGASTVELANGKTVDLAAEAAKLAEKKVGKHERWKLPHGKGGSVVLTLENEESTGTPATELRLSGEKEGKTLDRTIDLTSPKLGVMDSLGSGGRGARRGRGRQGGPLDRLPWDFRFDEAGLAEVLRAWEPTVLVDANLPKAQIHVETK